MVFLIDNSVNSNYAITMLTARPYQIKDEAAIYAAWASGAKNVCYTCPTGGGKTFIDTKIAAAQPGATAIIAHRSELVLQQSMSLASMGVRHRIIASNATTQFIRREHTREFKRHYYDPNGRAAVVAVDTLRARAKALDSWCHQVSMWAMDECHHVLRENKWGQVVDLFPNAWGLGVTATPNRADGKGIGRHAQGVFDVQVLGPTVPELMDAEYLSDYRIYAPPSDFDISALKMGGTGDYTRDSMIKETRRSHITGDIVQHYQRFARDKRAIVFAVDIESAGMINAAFVKAGIKSASVNGKSSDSIREEMVRRFRDGTLDVLVNVDLFGEGFDVPACDCVVMARPTQSLPLYLQMFGRALRVFKGKPHGIIIDHVSNVKRHLLPDSPREWNLDDRDKRARNKRDPDAIPLTTCLKCFQMYENVTVFCPFCGHRHQPAGRSLPEHVAGDLCELDPAALARMRAWVNQKMSGDADEMKRRMILHGTDPAAATVISRNHRIKQESHVILKHAIAWWAGHGKAKGMDDSEMYRRFYFMFGIDVVTAQGISGPDARELTTKIMERVG